VTPNVNTVYGFGFLDLSQEPIVITAPDSGGRYYMIELIDMWNNAFAYPAGNKVGYREVEIGAHNSSRKTRRPCRTNLRVR